MPAPQQQQRGGALTRKVGPLPLWGWLAVITLLAAGYWLYAKQKAAAAAAPPASSSTADVPQTVINTPVSVTVPGVPPPGKPPTNHKPPGGAWHWHTHGGTPDTLAQFAQEMGTTEAALVQLNPGLAQYQGKSATLPNIKIKVPGKAKAKR